MTDSGSKVVSLGIPEFLLFFAKLSQCLSGCIAIVVRGFTA